MAKKELDLSTEEKIKEAARKVFTEKGFSAARTRDIAEEAGMNLALLNYYFRSKERLFDIIMIENIQKFVVAVKGILNNESVPLKMKVEQISSNYIDMLVLNPDLPLFILSELRANPERLIDRLGVKGFLFKSHYFKQIKEAAKNQEVNSLHFFINTMALIVFPFVASPLLKTIGDIKQDEFTKLMLERKKLVAKWVEAMLKAK